MKVISNIFSWIKRHISLILLGIKFAKELEKKIDPKEKSLIEDQILEVAEEIAEKIKGKE